MFPIIKAKPRIVRPFKNSAMVSTGTPVHRVNAVRISQAVLTAFRTSGPIYRFSNGTSKARFVNVTVWKKTGEHVAFYEIEVRASGIVYVEKYVWAFRHGEFQEVQQMNVPGGFQRELVGWA